MLCRGAQINIRLQDTDNHKVIFPPILESKANDLRSPHSLIATINTVFFFLIFYLCMHNFLNFLTKLRRINLPFYNLFLI